MNKSVVFGVAAFGGLLIIAALVFNKPTTSETNDISEEVSPSVLPTEVTTNFPIYPDSAMKNIHESENEAGTTFYSFSLRTKAAKAEVNQWYREALSQNGWSVTSDKNVAGYQIIQGEKGNLYTSMQATNGDAPETILISQQTQIRSK